MRITIPFLEVVALLSQEPQQVAKRIDEWKLKLIDLSRRNRSIYFQPTKTSTINIVSPDIDIIFDRLIIKEKDWELWQPPLNNFYSDKSKPRKNLVLLPGWSDATQIDRILKNLKRRSSSEYTERGIRILYITYGILKWIDKESKQETFSPILMTPIELIKESTRSPYKIKVPPVEEDLIVNPALKLKLKYDYDINLPPLINENDEFQPSFYLINLKQILNEYNWIIENSCYLGLFSFSKLAIYQDLTENFNLIEKHPIIKSLSKIPIEGLIKKNLPKIEDLDQKNDLNKTYQILDADSSQQLCIQYALQGQSFIMHGPPGTGKSQTIANIISEYVAAGKSVLFVSEKMAALEVVYNRLKDRNLEEYCLELHSYKANKREVINELNRVLTEHLKPGKISSPEDIERLKTRKIQLNEYVTSLHKLRDPSNYSAYQILNELTKLRHIPEIPSGYTDFDKFNQKTFFILEEQVRRLANSWIVIEEGSSFPWKDAKVQKYSNEVRSDWVNLLTTIIASSNSLLLETEEFCSILNLELPEKIEEYDKLQRLANLINSTPYPPTEWLTTTDLFKLKQETEKTKIEWDQYWTLRKDLENKYDSRFRSLPKGSSDKILEAWINAKHLLQNPKHDDGGLLKDIVNLMNFLQNTLKYIPFWINSTQNIIYNLDLKTDDLSINQIRKILKLTELCESPNKPEPSWLERSTIKKVENIYQNIKKDHDRKNELEKKLDIYKDNILDLDLENIIAYLEGPGSSLFRYFRPSYYRIKEEISKVTKNGNIPDSIIQDLISVKELKKLYEKVEKEQEINKKILGVYYSKENIKFQSIEEAIKNAKYILKILKKTRASKKLRDNICVGTVPKKELLEQVKTLKSNLNSWMADKKNLKELLPIKIPNTNTPLTEASLYELEKWATELNLLLKILNNTSQPALITKISDLPSSFNQLIDDLKKTEKIQDFESDEAKKTFSLKQIYGNLYHGISTDWTKVIESIDWTRSFLLLLDSPPSNELIQKVTDPSLNRIQLKLEQNLKLIKQSINELNYRFTKQFWNNNPNDLYLYEVLNVADQFLSRIDDLQYWVDFNDTSKKLCDEGFDQFLTQIYEKKIDKNIIVDVFKKSIFNGLLTQFLEDDINLKNFRVKDHNYIVQDFINLDKVLIETSPNKIIEIANTNKPQGIFVEASDSEISILLREAAKKRRQMPIRHLFDKIPNLIRKLKPCLLMSPISVSQFVIPERLHFDLVIFDEASQIFTEDSVGAIYRGDCLIVAGDNKQLPPTPFFQYVADTDNDWDENSEDIGVYDSVLDECMSIGLPTKMLQWHYRSKHDSLISFSNNKFYDGKLILFPSAIHQGEDLGIDFVHVQNGLYDRGGTRTNFTEAEVVADLVFNHFKKTPNKSLGVVTFSINQMNCVKDEIENRLKNNGDYGKFIQEDRLQGFFVKNLENVQGDERDVMIISVGYGYDKNKIMTLNFGPLNKEGGERRLNVAITRAKEKVILVSSIKSSDINVNSTNSLGIKCLHEYLQYAETQLQKRFNAIISKPEDVTDIEKEVVEEIRKLGYVAVTNIGESRLKIDIGVKIKEEPEKYILGILIDGEYYSSIPTVRDRDRLRIQILENMGWNIYRIWSPEWVIRHSSEIDRLSQALKQAEESRNIRKLNISKNKKETINKINYKIITELESSKLPGAVEYVITDITPKITFNKIKKDQKTLYERFYKQEILQLLPKLVEVEEPIHQELAYKRSNNLLKVKPVTFKHKNIFYNTLNELIKKDKIFKSEDFLWASKNKIAKLRIPKEGRKNTIRKIEYIAPEEIMIAIEKILEHSLGLGINSLIQQTLKIYKIKKTQKTFETISNILEDMISEGKIIFNNDLFVLT